MACSFTLRSVAACSGLVLAAPSLARAVEEQGGAAEDGGRLGSIVVGVLIIGAAYVLAEKAVHWLQQRFLVMSGLEYLLLGMALGSDALGITLFRNSSPLLPIIALAAGWVGLMRGTQFSYREVRDGPKGLGTIVIGHHLVAGLAVGGAAYGLLGGGWIGVEVPWQSAAISAAALGCVAATDSTGPLDLLARRYQVGGSLTTTLRTATRLGDVLVIAAFGLLFCVAHEPAPGGEPESWFEWFGVTVALGALLGVLFRFFLEEDQSGHTRFLALVGIITFASGAAYFLRLSSLLVNLVMGLFLAYASGEGPKVQRTLVRTERPMSIVLLILAGALWRPTPLLPTLLGFVSFVVLRDLAKAAGSRVAGIGSEVRKDLYRGLLTHGDVALAMTVSFQVVYDGEAVDIAYSVLLMSIVLHDLIGPRMLRSLLVDQGELTRESPRSRDESAPDESESEPATKEEPKSSPLPGPKPGERPSSTPEPSGSDGDEGAPRKGPRVAAEDEATGEESSEGEGEDDDPEGRGSGREVG